MRVLYLDCSMGAAGDMLMAALYELLDDKQYAQNQKRKLEDYAAEGIQEKKNLLITKEHYVTDSRDPEKKRACIDLREIVLQLISFGKIAPQKAFRLLFPDKSLPKI